MRANSLLLPEVSRAHTAQPAAAEPHPPPPIPPPDPASGGPASAAAVARRWRQWRHRRWAPAAALAGRAPGGGWGGSRTRGPTAGRRGAVPRVPDWLRPVEGDNICIDYKYTSTHRTGCGQDTPAGKLGWGRFPACRKRRSHASDGGPRIGFTPYL